MEIQVIKACRVQLFKFSLTSDMLLGLPELLRLFAIKLLINNSTLAFLDHEKGDNLIPSY